VLRRGRLIIEYWLVTGSVPQQLRRWLPRPYLLRIGRFPVSSYMAALYIGFVTGLFAALPAARERGVDELRFVSAAVTLLVPALAGGRLWFLMQSPRNIFSRGSWRRGQGGAGLYGGLLLSVLVSPLVLWTAAIGFWPFWDAAAIILLTGMMITRTGCFLNGCCVGRATNGPLGVWLPDRSGQWKRRYPTQVLEALWTAAILATLLLIRDRLGTGELFLAGAIGYGAGRIGLERLRESAANRELSTRINVATSVAIVVLAAGLIIFRRYYQGA
jgi:prolipoprotein diacylglyceryl transferase